ncbi:hypothetical protein [Streptomyces ardesiacus]
MDKATERLLAMRSTAARYGHGIDKRDRDDVSSATRRAGELQRLAAGHHTQTTNARTEKSLPAVIAKEFLDLHDRETTGRRTLRQGEARRAVEHQQARVVQPQATQVRGPSRR